MTKLTRKYSRYKLDNLPKLKTGAFTYFDKKGYTGSVISRPVPNTISVYKHYGIIYGYDENEILWIIENNLDGIECITFHDFLNGQQFYDIECLQTPWLSDTIINRAKEKAFESYHARYNNCEHFKNYCWYGDSYSEQSDNTVELTNILLSILEIKAIISNHGLLESFTKFREITNIKRSNDFNESLEKFVSERNILEEKIKISFKEHKS